MSRHAVVSRRARSACALLSLLLLFLSYKPATALLSIAGAARNPTEGGRPAQKPVVDARENMPRPAKKQQCETRGRLVQKAQKRISSDGEKSALALLKLALPQATVRGLPPAQSRVGSEIAKPDYLRPFLPASPGHPQSPPA